MQVDRHIGLQPLPLEVGAVGAAQIGDPTSGVAALDHGVAARDALVVEDQVVAFLAANGHRFAG